MTEEENNAPETEQEEAPEMEQEKRQIVYLYGAMADRRTRLRRRTSRPGRTPKKCRLGLHRGIIVRRGRRVAVTLDQLLGDDVFAAQVKEYMDLGYLLILDGNGRAAPEEWLLEHDLLSAPTIPTRDEDTEEEDLTEEVTEEVTEEDSDTDETEEGSEGEEEADTDDETDDPDDAPSDETSDADEADPVATDGTDEGSSDEESDAGETTETTEVEDVPPMGLPENWETYVKRDLLNLMNQRDIPIPEDTRNDTLVQTIKEWAVSKGLMEG